MYKMHGFIDRPGLDGGAFTVHRADRDGVVEFLEKSCDGGSLLLVSIEDNARIPGFRDAFTWHAYTRDLCPSGSSHSDDIVHPSREDAARVMWEWMCEQWPDLTGTIDELTERLLDPETRDQVDLPVELGGGGWVSLLRLRVPA